MDASFKTVDKIILNCWINVIIMSNVLGVVSYKIFPARLGGQKGIALFYKYFSAYHHLTMATIKNNDPSLAQYPVLNVFSNSRLRYINPVYFFTLRKIIRREQITHIIIEHPYFGWLGLLLKWFCSIKLVVHSHNIEGLRFRSLKKWWWGLLRNYKRVVHKNADFTFCITEEDRQYMINQFRVRPGKLALITYGIEISQPPLKEEKAWARQLIQERHGILDTEVIFLFNGTLDYKPNLDALSIILHSLNPIYSSKKVPYKIIICGKNLPAELNDLQAYKDKNIIYAGFVEDISLYFKGSDIFINPVIDGGGIKTKLVEALGYNLTVVSTMNGAAGVNQDLGNQKLIIIPDGNWEKFADGMIAATHVHRDTPDEFYTFFYWDHIAEKAARIISDKL